MKDKDFRIHIKIDGRVYPLNINRDDEERYRKAAKIVEETISGFRKMFQNNDNQDIMAMTAFQVALRYTEEQQCRDYSQFIDEIKDITDDISDFIKEKDQK
ncbi:cell division protein ZapA [Draconibacterium sp. IB214405]|uniref:cell division protein ZapA n=1 Tax=Draconibacterium sp. IB214405 TaxID=3097352 RepID=UPI002A15F057|nr:cell division protein ZapA [Draconibacterium sp. IB214405]MDX8339846.1 cell division protein ZapA [Draconibacterium sp. IB214405]